MTFYWWRSAKVRHLETVNWQLAFENAQLKSQRDALIAANAELQRALSELLEMADEEPAAGDDHVDKPIH